MNSGSSEALATVPQWVRRVISSRRGPFYRVEQVFLIHRDSGLLLQHVHVPGQPPPRPPEQVSAALSALLDFFRECFPTCDGERLLTIALCRELSLQLAHGATMTLASVARLCPTGTSQGVVPTWLTGPPDAGASLYVIRERLDAQRARIEDRFRRELEAFNGDTTPFDTTRPLMETCLHTAAAPPCAPPESAPVPGT